MSYPSSLMKALRIAGVLALTVSLITPALAIIPVSPGVNLSQLEAQVTALQTTVNNQQTTNTNLQNTVTTLQTTVNSQQTTINSQAGTITALQNTVNRQAATIAGLQTLTSPLSLTGTPGTYPATLEITGVNVQIDNGLDATDGNAADPTDALNDAITNGLGNLIIGYNESQALINQTLTDTRTGSHNLILGDFNNYSSFGGLVGGQFNTISERYASVVSGQYNTSSSFCSVVVGGQGNKAIADGFSVVTGGLGNTASGRDSEVTGGSGNTASGTNSVVH